MSSKDGAADQVTGFARWLERALAAAATACHRHPWRAVGIALVLTVASALATSKLHIDTSMRSLLPRSFRSVVDTERLEKVFGGVGYVAVVARNATPEQLKKFAEDTAPRIEARNRRAGVDGSSLRPST